MAQSRMCVGHASVLNGLGTRTGLSCSEAFCLFAKKGVSCRIRDGLAAVRLSLVDRYTSHVFSHATCTCDHTHIVAQGVFGAHFSPHPHAIQDVTCLSVRLLSLRVCLFPVSLPLLLCLFHCLPVVCPAHHLQCRHR